MIIAAALALMFLGSKRKHSDPKDLSEYDLLKRLHRSVRDASRQRHRFMRAFARRIKAVGPRADAFIQISDELFKAEFSKLPLPSRRVSETELKQFRKWLEGYKAKADLLPKNLKAFGDTLFDSYQQFERSYPKQPDKPGTHALTVPLVDLISEPAKVVESILEPFFRPEVYEPNLFSKLRQRVRYLENTHGRPSRFEGTTRALVSTYFSETPFAKIFEGDGHFHIPLEKQLEHSMIAAGSRYGKSQLLGWLIAEHLKSDDPPGIIIIDSTGDFLEKISHLNVFSPDGGRLADRLLILDPDDTPQLNMFDMTALHSRGYSAEDLELAEAEIINLFDYVFSSIGGDLTSQQSTGFTFIVRLLLSRPNPSLDSLRELLDLPGRSYADAPKDIRASIERLDDDTQSFFKHHFFSMLTTRQAVSRRLLAILRNKFFKRMFMGGNNVDFFQAMQDGKIIVVNTAKHVLKDGASQLFGRYVIARVMSAAFERAFIKDRTKRRPCLMYIDEAQEYFDSSIETLLTQIAKFRLAICICFQTFASLDERLLASVLGNTTVKYAGGLRVAEARMISKEMRVHENFILAQRKDTRDDAHPKWAQFATHIKYKTEQAVSLAIPFYALESMPKMSFDAYQKLRKLNRELVNKTPQKEPSPSPAPPQPDPEPPPRNHQSPTDDTWSEDWQ